MALHVKIAPAGGILYDQNFIGDGISVKFPSSPDSNLIKAKNMQVYLEGTLLTSGSASDEYVPNSGYVTFNFAPTADTRIRIIGLTL